MKNKTIITAAIFSYFVLYSPQPLLPLFASQYHVSIASAGALMTATLIPLAIAPLLYGYLLSALTPLRLLRYALFIMSVSCLFFAHSQSYSVAFAIRFIQGLLLPAVLTAITTHIATHSTHNQLQKNMSLFITGTIIGGLFGRVLSGLFATYSHWQYFYYGLTIVLLITVIYLPKDDNPANKQYTKIPLNSIITVLLTPNSIKIYTSIFCLFFSFVAVLNYLPFIIKAHLDQVTPATIGLIYSGFIMGAISSLNAQRLLTLVGNAKHVMTLGFLVFLSSILLLFVPNIFAIFCMLFIFCGAMFLVHSLAASEINKLNKKNKSIVNALYMTFYYGGGVMGSYFPGLIYQKHGTSALLLFLFAISSLGLFMVLLLKSQPIKVSH